MQYLLLDYVNIAFIHNKSEWKSDKNLNFFTWIFANIAC